MRNIVLGILLGAWITTFLALLEKYKMADYALLIAFGVISFLLVFVATFRLWLKVLMHISPRLFVFINRITAPATVDDARRIIEDKRQKQAKTKGLRK